jgi:hypothetical protein
MRACPPPKKAWRWNLSSLLEEEALTIPHEFGIDVYELCFHVARRKFVHFAKASGVNEAPSLTDLRADDFNRIVDRLLGSQQ